MNQSDRDMDEAELRRLRAAWAEGIPEYVLRQRHQVGAGRIKKECADVPRPVKPVRKRQTPAGIGWDA